MGGQGFSQNILEKMNPLIHQYCQFKPKLIHLFQIKTLWSMHCPLILDQLFITKKACTSWLDNSRNLTFTLSANTGPGVTQIWVGYGGATRSFDHHPISKPEKMQNCNLYPNHLFFEGPFFKPISTLNQVYWDSESTFWQPIYR